MPFLLLLAGVGVLAMILYPSTVLAYVQGVATSIQLVPIDDQGHGLRADAAAAFRAMAAAATAAGIALVVDSAFRTEQEQEDLWERYQAGTGNLAATPGYSNHQSGIAVDIAVGNSFVSPTYKWLAANAVRFGFTNTGKNFSQQEPWHWEFRG